MLDRFPYEPVKYRRKSYDHLAHAQWACFFAVLDLEAHYKPKKFTQEWLGTERYKPGSKSTYVDYEPAFYLPELGYWDVTCGPICAQTWQLAERLSNKTREAVYVAQDAPHVPSRGRDGNTVVVCRDREMRKPDCRMMHNGRRFFVGKPTQDFYVYAPQIVDAARHAELLGGR